MTRLWQPFLLLLAACAQPSSSPQVEATDAWARATARGQSTGAIYLTLRNRGAAGDALVGVTAARASSAMLHISETENGISRMRMADRIEVPAGKTVKLKPGGAHIMLQGGPPYVPPEQFDVMLRFESGATVTVPVQVVEPGSR